MFIYYLKYISKLLYSGPSGFQGPQLHSSSF